MAVMLISILGLGLETGNVFAHGEGGYLRLSNQPLGADNVSARYLHAWTSPAIARTGEIHIEALVTDESLQSTGNQRVLIKVTPVDGKGESMRMVAAPNMLGNQNDGRFQPARQEASFLIERPGQYEVEITVLDVAGQGGRHRFDMKVISFDGWIKRAMQGMLALLALVGGWLFFQGAQLIASPAT